jgi:hypothetical protein
MSLSVERVNMFGYVAYLVEKTIKLLLELGAAGLTVTSVLLNALQAIELAWQALFRIANIIYNSVGFRTAQQAVAQMVILRNKIVEFKEKYLSKIQRWIRSIISDPASDNSVVRAPTLEIGQLVTTGTASATTSVWTAANALSVEMVKWEAEMPNAFSDDAVSPKVLASEALGHIIDGAAASCALLHPDMRVVGAFERKETPYCTSLVPAGTTVMATAGATSRSVMLIAAVGAIGYVGRYGDDHNAYIFVTPAGGVTWTDGLGFPTELIGRRVTLEFYVPRATEAAAITSALNAASASTAVMGPATNDTIDVETALTTSAGPSSIIVTQTGNVVKRRTFTVTANTRLSATTVAAAWFTFKIYKENDQGSMWLSTDGVLEPVNCPNARVIDCIGGINVRETLDTLNFNGFELIMNMCHAAATAHGDAAVFNMMNLHYVNHLRSADEAAALNTYVVDPLKSYNFWLGSDEFTGIKKTTRQSLWRTFYPIICTQMNMLKSDGTITYYLEH